MTWSVHLILPPYTVSSALGRDDPAWRERLSEFQGCVAVVLAAKAEGDDGRSSIEEVPAQENV
jgi:hypothetical protein